MVDLANPKAEKVMSQFASTNCEVWLLAGPNGAGKGSIGGMLLSSLSDYVIKGVRTTSRPLQIGEMPTYDYYFVTQGQFEQGISAGAFLEWSKYGQGYYGTQLDIFTFTSLMNKHLLFDLDCDATQKMRQLLEIHSITVRDAFVSPVSIEMLSCEEGIQCALDTLQRRMTVNRNRGEVPKEITGRLKKADQWLRRTNEFGTVIANIEGQLDLAVQSAQQFFLNN